MPEEEPKTTTEKEILAKLSTREEGLVETEVQERLLFSITVGALRAG
ncbi:MAG: hypothetical protein L6277_14500 [Desulfobacterales bacterium]|nr:hypothetical protein [Pseudomonadota bacterium]MCG2773284.1 hypothetical protein [Desulfobacterales bacterium]